MNTAVHLQYGWLVANLGDFDLRERRMIMASSLLADLDGAALLLFPVRQFLPGWLSDLDPVALHHTFSHNIFFAALAGAVFSLLSRRRRARIFLVCAFTLILQVVIDNFTNDQTWPIMYLWPVSRFDTTLSNFTSWPHLGFATVYLGQGALTVLGFAATAAICLRRQRTFLELLSARLDRFITDFMLLPFGHACAQCQNRAHYRCRVCGKLFCIRHTVIKPDLTLICKRCRSAQMEKASED